MDKTKYVYVNEHLISPSLICPICLDILQDPHTHVSCDSAFCRSCLLQLTDPICPICRWNWDDMLPIQYNTHLPKTNRLIRNMLDDLPVKCLECDTVFRRGQLEHKCESMNNSLFIQSKIWENFQIILFPLVIFFFILFIYHNRHFVFETAIDRRSELISGTGTDIDQYLFEKIFYLLNKIIEYSSTIVIFNLFLWFSIIFYGDRFTSKTTNRSLKNFLEILIIINLITYSIYY